MKLFPSHIALASLLALSCLAAQALTLQVRGEDGKPLGLVMVTQVPDPAVSIDGSDNGYPASGKLQRGVLEATRFTDAMGQAVLPDSARTFRLRLRKPGFKVLVLGSADLGPTPVLTLV